MPLLLPRHGPDELEALADAVLAMRPAELEQWTATLDEADMAVVELAMARRTASGWRSDPAAMAAHLTADTWNTARFNWNWRYVRLLSEKFRQLVTGESKRQIWNLPSRYGKSLIGSRWGPTWAFDQHPDANMILVSYGDDLAMENATAVRDLLREHASMLRTTLRKDRQRADRFVTEHGGGLLAGGIDSGLTGFGAGNHGGAVVDDPLKNWQEAMSKARREHVFNQYRSVVRSRLDDSTAWVLISHTRWHMEDPTGKLTAQQNQSVEELQDRMEQEDQQAWEIVRLPAIAVAAEPHSPDLIRRLPDPLGREPGEVIEPEKFTLVEVQSRAADYGSFLASAMEQQDPSPEEGGELKRDWWRWADAPPVAFDDAASSWDMKLKDNETGDFVVGQAWGRTGSDYWMVEQLRGQYNLVTTKLAIALLAVRHPWLKRHYIENSGNGPDLKKQLGKPDPKYVVRIEEARGLGMTDAERAAVQKLLRRGMNRLILVTPKGSKEVRARAVSGILESGHVWLKNNDMQALSLVNEAAEFPNGVHDDQVDAWSQAMSKLDVRGDASVSTAKTQARPEPTPGQAPQTVQRKPAGAAAAARRPGQATITTATRRRRLPTAR